MIIEKEDYPVTILRKRIKNLNLRINAVGNVTLSAPLTCPLNFIHTYLQEKHEWIRFHRTKLLTQPLSKPFQYTTGEHHFWLGNAYELIVIKSSLKKQILIKEEQIFLFIKNNTIQQECQALLMNWYRQQFKILMPGLLKKWEPVIGVQVKEWGIKTMKSRWGSCNTQKKRIWLNLHLIKKSLECIEYVLVHELVHLLEPSHNKRFYKLNDPVYTKLEAV